MSRRCRVALLGACVALGGCTATVPPPPAAAPSRPGATSRAPSLDPPAPPPVAPSPVPVPASSSPAGFPRDTAVGCAGNPGVDRIVALVRARGILDATQTATATLGPLCAGTWQYTVLQAPQREPLQVVSRGPATALVMVTAGTDICTDAVRGQAPLGIIAAARC